LWSNFQLGFNIESYTDLEGKALLFIKHV